MQNNKPRLILIHGLHQNSLIMKPLAKKLAKHGFDVHCFNYASVTKPLLAHSHLLHEWLMKHHDAAKPIYMVGHSMGGLVMRDFMSRYPKWHIAHCVTLGTPHLGSTTAHYSKKILPFMVGMAYQNGLDGQVADMPNGVSLGIIAGSKAGGLGSPFLWHNSYKHKHTPAESINDGTVYVNETKLPSAKEHIVLPVSHTGMLFNAEVAENTIHFLQQGVFINV